MQLPPGLAAGAGAPAAPPGGPPGAPPGMPPQRPPMPGAGAPPQPPMGGMNIMTMLAFLAGAGLDKVVGSISKLQSPAGQGAARQHRPGVRLEAAQNPSMTIAPLLAKLMASQQAGVPQPPPGPPGPPMA